MTATSTASRAKGRIPPMKLLLGVHSPLAGDRWVVKAAFERTATRRHAGVHGPWIPSRKSLAGMIRLMNDPGQPRPDHDFRRKKWYYRGGVPYRWKPAHVIWRSLFDLGIF